MLGEPQRAETKPVGCGGVLDGGVVYRRYRFAGVWVLI